MVQGRPQPSEGEAMAILFGIQSAKQHKWSRVILETDCLPVYCYLCRQASDLVSYGAVLEACFNLSSCFISLSFYFVRRAGNSLAHSIATAWDLSTHEGSFLPHALME